MATLMNHKHEVIASGTIEQLRERLEGRQYIQYEAYEMEREQTKRNESAPELPQARFVVYLDTKPTRQVHEVRKTLTAARMDAAMLAIATTISVTITKELIK